MKVVKQQSQLQTSDSGAYNENKSGNKRRKNPKNKPDIILSTQQDGQCLPSALLLAYTYFLGDAGKKMFTIGHKCADFSACIILRNESKPVMILSALEWSAVYLKFTTINETIKSVLLHGTMRISMEHKYEARQPPNYPYTQVKVQVLVCSNLYVEIMVEGDEIQSNLTVKVRLIKKFNKPTTVQMFEMEHEEWTTLWLFSEFVNSIMGKLRANIPYVSAYYDMYVSICKELNTTAIEPQGYFNYHPIRGEQVNYSRLFYELPILANEKLRESIQ